MGLLSAILFTSNCGSLSHDEADRVLKGRDIGEDADGHREVFDGVLGLGIRRLGLGKICVFKKNVARYGKTKEVSTWMPFMSSSSRVEGVGR